jgi:hypothetical protein
MAVYYGSAVSSSGAPSQNTYGASATSAGFAHSRIRKTWSTYSNASPYVATSDLLVIGLFKPSDKIIDVKFFTDGAGTNGAFDCGVYSVARSNGALETPVVIDADLFASAKATGTAILYGSATATIFTESTNLTDADRGKALWKLADLGAGTYTSDPGGVWAIVADFTTIEDATSFYGFEIEYVAGD